MKMSVKVSAGVIFAAVVALALTWPYLEMEFAGSARYTEQDSRKYEFYTPELLKKMPRISEHFDFDFTSVSGPEALVWSANFYGISDAGRIRDYLTSVGWLRQVSCDIEAECWRLPGSADVVTVSKSASSREVNVQVYRSPDTEKLPTK